MFKVSMENYPHETADNIKYTEQQDIKLVNLTSIEDYFKRL